jgi:hypothetical protein
VDLKSTVSDLCTFCPGISWTGWDILPEKLIEEYTSRHQVGVEAGGVKGLKRKLKLIFMNRKTEKPEEQDYQFRRGNVSRSGTKGIYEFIDGRQLFLQVSINNGLTVEKKDISEKIKVSDRQLAFEQFVKMTFHQLSGMLLLGN